MKVFHEFMRAEVVIIATNAMAEYIDNNATNCREQHNLIHAMPLECLELGVDRRELNWDANHHLDQYTFSR